MEEKISRIIDAIKDEDIIVSVTFPEWEGEVKKNIAFYSIKLDRIIDLFTEKNASKNIISLIRVYRYYLAPKIDLEVRGCNDTVREQSLIYRKIIEISGLDELCKMGMLNEKIFESEKLNKYFVNVINSHKFFDPKSYYSNAEISLHINKEFINKIKKVEIAANKKDVLFIMKEGKSFSLRNSYRRPLEVREEAITEEGEKLFNLQSSFKKKINKNKNKLLKDDIGFFSFSPSISSSLHFNGMKTLQWTDFAPKKYCKEIGLENLLKKMGDFYRIGGESFSFINKEIMLSKLQKIERIDNNLYPYTIKIGNKSLMSFILKHDELIDYLRVAKENSKDFEERIFELSMNGSYIPEEIFKEIEKEYSSNAK